MSQQYTISEVKKHKNSKSAWMIVHNNVYDVTNYIYEHPGGADNILDYAGKDGTDAFEEIGHSSDARIVLEKFKIGTLIASEHTKYIETCSKLKWAMLALAGALILGIVIRKYAS